MGREEKDFASVVTPAWLRTSSTGRGNLPSPGHRWKATDVDVRPPRFIGCISEPFSVRRDLTFLFVGRFAQQRRDPTLRQSQHRQIPLRRRIELLENNAGAIG